MVDRREFLKLAAVGGGAVFASGLAGCAASLAAAGERDFHFVQLSDTHWGFQGPPNPEAATPGGAPPEGAKPSPEDLVKKKG